MTSFYFYKVTPIMLLRMKENHLMSSLHNHLISPE
nr:MAG TPA: hypothetical protein [Bacteriophage sp.]